MDAETAVLCDRVTAFATHILRQEKDCPRRVIEMKQVGINRIVKLQRQRALTVSGSKKTTWPTSL